MKTVKNLITTALAASICTPFALSANIVVPAAINDHVPLATAYNSVENDFLNYQSVRGNVEVNTASQSRTVYKMNMDLKEVSSVINGNVSIDADFPIIDVQANADVALASSKDEFSSTWVYSQVLNGPNKKLIPENGSFIVLSPQGQKVSDKIQNEGLSNSERLARAGTHYVSQINYGASLLVVMKAEYLSTSDRTAVQAAIDVDFAAGSAAVDGSVDISELKQSVKITVRAHQFGGDPLHLTSVLPENIVQCSLDNFQPCKDLFDNAIAYAKDETSNGFYEQIAGQISAGNLDALNTISYSTSPYESYFNYMKEPSGGYGLDNYDLTPYEDEYEIQLDVYKRATALLGDLQPTQSTTQRSAVRAIGQAALANTATLKDIVGFCRDNPYAGDCSTYIANYCPTQSGQMSCLNQYSEGVLHVGNTELERALEIYNQPSVHNSASNIAKDVLSARWPYTGGGSVNGSTGEITSTNNWYPFGDDWGDSNYNGITRTFLIKSNKLLRATKSSWGNSANYEEYLFKTYKDDKWQVFLRNSTKYDAVRDGAQQVNGFYYYLMELDNVSSPLLYLNPQNVSSGSPLKMTFFTSDVEDISTGNGFNRDNIPYYFTNRAISIDKDVNGATIGRCINGSSLTMATNDKCRNEGRLYTWGDAVKACEAYNDYHQNAGESAHSALGLGGAGLVWRLPSKQDYIDFADRIEQIELMSLNGAGKAGTFLKNWNFSGTQAVGTNILGFNFEPAGFYNTSYQQGGNESWSWTNTESGGNAFVFGLKANNEGTFHNNTANKNHYRSVRCIGTYTK